MGYLANFMVYTLAMVGVIVIALLVFKNATSAGGCKSSKYLKLIDTMSLGSRKTLYIVSTGTENFLIAGDMDKTSLISKLDKLEPLMPQSQKKNIEESFKDTIDMLVKPCYMDKSGIRNTIIRNSQKEIQNRESKPITPTVSEAKPEAIVLNGDEVKRYKSVMRSLADQIRG